MTFVCEKCDANFTKKYNLSRHQSTHHQQNNVDNRFECNECNRKFNRKDILVRHIEILHKYKRDSFVSTKYIKIYNALCSISIFCVQVGNPFKYFDAQKNQILTSSL
uniref:Zinc finger protein n=1 Tax=Schizaphis graminum TaxID=13262 RepID=A0A2S2PR52_SCHGA